jgi:hypothetical protein
MPPRHVLYSPHPTHTGKRHSRQTARRNRVQWAFKSRIAAQCLNDTNDSSIEYTYCSGANRPITCIIFADRSAYSSYSWLIIPAKNRRVSDHPFCYIGCWRLTPEKSPSSICCLFFSRDSSICLIL